MKTKLILLFINLSILFFCSAQNCYEIQNVSSIPATPCAGEEVYLVVENSLCTICDCEADSVGINFTTAFPGFVDSYYIGSDCDFVCTAFDTIFIGTMPIGDWNFYYSLKIENPQVYNASEYVTIPNCNQFNPTTIDSVYVLQENLCEGDSLQVVVELFTSSACSCNSDSSMVQILNTFPQLNAYYSFGLCAATCSSFDTLEIGAFQAGTYTYEYNAIQTDYFPATNIASYFFDFTVDDCINSYDAFLDSNISLYPNPTQNLFQIEGLLGNYDIQILDVAGNVYQSINTNQNYYAIDLSNLPNGMFLVSIQQVGNANVRLEKIIKY